MPYLISLGAGLVVGLPYYFSRVRSPAPHEAAAMPASVSASETDPSCSSKR